MQGEWKPKQIDNPNYKGEWVHPEIDNPDYTADDKLYKYDDIGAIGFDLWQVGFDFNHKEVEMSKKIKFVDLSSHLIFIVKRNTAGIRVNS